MSSNNKKKKPHQVSGGHKEKQEGTKRTNYTSSSRQKLKEELEQDLLDIDIDENGND